MPSVEPQRCGHRHQPERVAALPGLRDPLAVGQHGVLRCDGPSHAEALALGMERPPLPGGRVTSRGPLRPLLKK